MEILLLPPRLTRLRLPKPPPPPPHLPPENLPPPPPPWRTELLVVLRWKLTTPAEPELKPPPLRSPDLELKCRLMLPWRELEQSRERKGAHTPLPRAQRPSLIYREHIWAWSSSQRDAEPGLPAAIQDFYETQQYDKHYTPSSQDSSQNCCACKIDHVVIVLSDKISPSSACDFGKTGPCICHLVLRGRIA